MRDKMKISAVICELNPLHQGHKSIINRGKEENNAVVCIMSGNFVQRGEPAILDKWARCRLALESGADLVIELPLPWACAGAERFASGGVSLAAAIGADQLIFGSEDADSEKLAAVAEALISPEFSQILQDLPDGGETFARRRQLALAGIIGSEAAGLLEKPNAILAVEYCKAIARQGVNIKPVAVLRVGANHDTPGKEGEIPSASQLRELMSTGKAIDRLIPKVTATCISQEMRLGRCPVNIEKLEQSILCKLRSMSPSDFATLPDLSEGLENRLYQGVRSATSLEELYALTKTKRYTHARVRRLVLSAFLGIHQNLPALPPYLRILGFSPLGEELIRNKSISLPLALRPGDFDALGGDCLSLFKLEAQADDIYALAYPTPQPCGRDYTEKVFKLRNPLG